MNVTTDTPVTRKKKTGHVFAAIGIVLLLAVSSLYIAHTRTKPPPQTTQSPMDTSGSYVVLAPTNAILKYYAVSEGDRISRSAMVAVMISPALEKKLHTISDKVANARMNLQQLRSSAQYITPTMPRTISPATPKTINESEYLNEIRKLSLTLDTLYSRVELLKNAPFKRDRNLREIAAVEREIASTSALLDIAKSGLENLKNQGNTAKPIDSANFSQDSGLARGITTAQERLRLHEAELAEIENEISKKLYPIKSPFAGTVMECSVPEGTFVRQGHPIAVIIRPPQSH